MRRRVAITGVGLVSAAGSTLAALGDALFSGRSAGGRIRAFDAEKFPTRIAAEAADVERAAARADAEAKRFAEIEDWKSAFGVLAARRALADSGSPDPDPARTIAVLGTGLSSVVPGELEEDVLPFCDGGDVDLARLGSSLAERRARFAPARHLTDLANRAIARIAGAGGVSLSHFGACAASTQAVGDAFRRIREGGADVAIAGGMDSMVHPFGMISFMLLGALSTKNDPPGAACKPFHKDRDGFLMGEGAAMFVLEDLAAAKRRGAKIHAELLGYGSSVDGYNVTAPRPDGAGAAAAMRHALRDARVEPARIGYVNAHGTGTDLNDPAECKAMRDVFGAHAAKVAVSSVKPVFGHTIAAAGALELAACVASLAANRLPPTPNLEEKLVDRECGGVDHVIGRARAGCPDVLMKNNYGFGGQNASLIVARAV